MTTGPGLSVVEEFVESKDRTKLFLRSWSPGKIRAAVVVVHEPGSDGARFRCLAETLAARGIATIAIDLRGCGRSPGPRRRIASLDIGSIDRLSDVRTLVSSARRRHPALPLFMFGHGIGALLACHYAVEHEGALDGIISEAVVLRPWKAALLRTLPWLRLPDAAVFRFDRRLRRSLGGLSLPLLLLHGSQDTVASASDSERLYRYVQSGDKTLQLFEGYDHDLVDDPGHPLVRDKISQWIETQLDSHSSRRRIGIEYINE